MLEETVPVELQLKKVAWCYQCSQWCWCFDEYKITVTSF